LVDLARDLAAWGVLLDEGQRYLAPDTGLLQYKKFAEIFTENYGEARKEAETLAAQKNWQALSFSVHSLKSKARAIGAEELHITAAGLEKHCILDDGAYIETAMPLLFLEWERSCRGLEQFISRMDALTGAGE
jgi:HPt (histidine-containing phosphotransfer) domain-containing protein